MRSNYVEKRSMVKITIPLPATRNLAKRSRRSESIAKRISFCRLETQTLFPMTKDST